MSSWRLKMNKCTSGGGVQTLESLRSRLRIEAQSECANEAEQRDDLFPSDECLEVDGFDPVEQQCDIVDQAPLPPPVPECSAPKPSKRRTAKKDKEKEKEKKAAVEKLCLSEDEGQSKCSDEETEPETAAGACGGEDDEMAESDLSLAFSAILSDFKKLTQRVKSLSSVLTDAQAAAVRRSFSGLSKSLYEAAEIATGGAKAPAAPRKKKAAPKK
ncbi:late transcription factor VLTF-4-like protein [Seal parapoxvirus]|uniref:Late transcription factor VLTF-4-like protein n=1 Tax=Seal parapoxvirus TaxID=187984 RepID=A0A1Z4CGG4_9POXV|nr:late transcription factor VLTF-4-like protein [Seal parapoxvirus]ASF89970.1 late transcription factor VLTF-4-like protein [Seal parapoxvirus]